MTPSVHGSAISTEALPRPIRSGHITDAYLLRVFGTPPKLSLTAGLQIRSEHYTQSAMKCLFVKDK